MSTFEEKLKVLQIDGEKIDDPDDIEELLAEAGEDKDKLFWIWRAMGNSGQLKFKNIFQTLTEDRDITLDKKIEIWSITGATLQMRNTEYFESLMSSLMGEEINSINLKSIIETLTSTHTTTLSKLSKVNMNKYLDFLIENSDNESVFDILKIIDKLPKDTKLREDIFDRQDIVFKKCMDIFNQTLDVTQAIELYSHNDYMDGTDPDFVDSKTLSNIVKTLSSNPNITFESIQSGKIKIFDEKIIQAIVERDDAKLPQDGMVLMQKIMDNKYMQNKFIKQDERVISDLVRKVNDSMTNTTLTDLESAYSLFKFEMSIASFNPQIIKNPNFVEEVRRTIGRCDAYCRITKDPLKLCRMYNYNESMINQIFDAIPDGTECKRAFKDQISSVKNTLSEFPIEVTSEFGKRTIDILGVDTFGKGLKGLHEQGRKMNDKYELTAEQAKKILDATDFPIDAEFSIVCKNASEISVEDVDRIEGRLKCKSIRFEDTNIGTHQKKEYSMEQYKMCRAKLDEVIGSIVIPPNAEQDREKRIFGQVMTRLAHHMKYNHEHVNAKKRIELELGKLEEDSTIDQLTKKEKRITLKNELSQLDYTTPRNMIGGLLQGECVCAGYAEIVRNAMACLEIEATYVRGYDDKNGHAWNQIKLDGEWFNMDLTWARDDLIVPNRVPFHLLVNDQDFNSGKYIYVSSNGETKQVTRGGHENYSNRRSPEHECKRTITPFEVFKYVRSTPQNGITYEEWLNHASDMVTDRQVRDARRRLPNDIRNENNKEQDKNKSYR